MGEALITRRGGGGPKKLKLIASGTMTSNTRITVTLPKPLSSYNRLVFVLPFSYTTKSSTGSTTWTSIPIGIYKGNVNPSAVSDSTNRMFVFSPNLMMYAYSNTFTGSTRCEALLAPYKDAVVELGEVSNGASPSFYMAADGTFFNDANVITMLRGREASGTAQGYGTYTIHYTNIEIYGVEA